MKDELHSPLSIHSPEHAYNMLAEPDHPYAGDVIKHFFEKKWTPFWSPTFRQEVTQMGPKQYNSVGLIVHTNNEKYSEMDEGLASIVGHIAQFTRTREEFHVERGANKYRHGSLWLLTPIDRQGRPAQGAHRLDLLTMTEVGFESTFYSEGF
jgi:hypothetical protein